MANQPSPIAKAQKDFIRMNQVNTEAAKKDIRKKPCLGRKDRSMGLPHENFIYGMKNRPHTPIKDMINNVYGNNVEVDIRKSYERFLKERNVVKKLVAKVTPYYLKMKAKKKAHEAVKEKPMYKLKMFQDVGSKVTEGIKAFKTYKPFKTEGNGVNNIVNKVQGEIKEKEYKEHPSQIKNSYIN